MTSSPAASFLNHSMPIPMWLTRQELNPISFFFQRIVIPASTATVPVFLNINKDSANLSWLQIKFNYTVYTNRLSSYGAVRLLQDHPFIFQYLWQCVCAVVHGCRVFYRGLNTLCAGDWRLGNATVSNFSSQLQTARKMEQLWLLLLFRHLCFVPLTIFFPLVPPLLRLLALPPLCVHRTDSFPSHTIISSVG